MTFSRTQTILLLLGAAIVFGFTLFQASWLAAKPTGKPKLVADRSIDPVRDTDGCIASVNAGYGATIVGPDIGALQAAVGAGADAVRIEVEGLDDRMVIARQFKSGCAADMLIARSTVGEAAFGMNRPGLFWDIEGAEQAVSLLGWLHPEALFRSIFIGDEAAVTAIRKAQPVAEALSVAGARTCASEYRVSGLWGRVPASCRDGTMLLTLDDLGYTLWGWPNAFLARMKDADVRVIIAEDVVDGKIKGLTDITQYGEIADSYNGYIWVDNIADLGPALKR